jgi:hypothetical protein
VKGVFLTTHLRAGIYGNSWPSQLSHSGFLVKTGPEKLAILVASMWVGENSSSFYFQNEMDFFLAGQPGSEAYKAHFSARYSQITNDCRRWNLGWWHGRLKVSPRGFGSSSREFECHPLVSLRAGSCRNQGTLAVVVCSACESPPCAAASSSVLRVLISSENDVRSKN